MKNYDIEMWRYAKELKTPSPIPALGHEHVPDRSATLQSVVIRTNDWGLRGGPVRDDKPQRRILFLGGSITLGWGVPEQETVTARLQQMFKESGEDVEVLNGGVGNYNAERYVERFFHRLKGLNPTDIVVHYFLRDAEQLDPGGGNWMLRHSELAVAVWVAANRLFSPTGEHALIDHYKEVYDPTQPGFISMRAHLAQLAEYAREHHIRIYMAMMPDIHNLKNYPFTFIHEQMKRIAADDGYSYVDLLPKFLTLSPEQIWAMPGDPHPNGLGHKLMADAIFPILNQSK